MLLCWFVFYLIMPGSTINIELLLRLIILKKKQYFIVVYL